MCKITASNWPVVLMAMLFAVLLLGVGHPIEFLAYFIHGLVLAIPVVFGLFVPTLLQSYNQPLLRGLAASPSLFIENIILFVSQFVLYFIFCLLGLFNYFGFFIGILWLIIVSLATYGMLYAFNLKADKLKGKVCKVGSIVLNQVVIALCLTFSTVLFLDFSSGVSSILVLSLLLISIAGLGYLRREDRLSKEGLLGASYVLILLFLSILRAETITKDRIDTMSMGMSSPIAAVSESKATDATDKAAKTKDTSKKPLEAAPNAAKAAP